MVSCIIVDDERDTTESYSERLASNGLDILGIGYNGKEAVELYKKVKPDVVYLDINMPEYDGFYAIDKIRKINPLAIILVLTASVSKGTMDEIKGKNLFVFSKPFNFDLLLSVTKELVKNS